MASNCDPAESRVLPPATGPILAGGFVGADEQVDRVNWRRWFRPRFDWSAKHALLPAELCNKVLDIYAWAGALVGAISAPLVFLQNPEPLRQNPLYWTYCAAAVVQLAIALLRGIPFIARYAVLAGSLVLSMASASLAFGITPNWLFGVTMLLTSTGMFFGMRAGFGALAAICAVSALVGWARVTDIFPVSVSEAETAATYLNFRSPSVWTRVVLATAVFMTALLVVMRHVLRSLNEAVKDSTAVARHLALEREQRGQAVEALQASEEKFSKVFRFSPDAISVADLETGRYLDINEGFERLFGRTRAQMIGRTASETGHWADPEDRARFRALLMQHGSVRDFQARGRRSDGALRTFLVSAETVEIADRKALVVAGRDITDHLQGEQALRESEVKFSTMFRASPIAISVTDLRTGRIIDANDAFLSTFACTREQVIGRTTLELGVWSDPAEREKVVGAMRAGQPVRDFKAKGRTLPGHPITVLVNCELIEVQDQPALLTMVQDITEQERSETALRESEEKFSKAFRSGPDAMSIAELETGRYLEVNEGFLRLFGYSREEVIGRTSLELGIWREAAERQKLLQLLQAHGAVRDLEVESANRRGEKIVALLSSECMQVGGMTCVVSVLHDISDRTRAEIEKTRAIERERQAREEFTRRLIAAQETERRRIAGELHDSLGQNLLLVMNRARLGLTSEAMPAELRWQFESIYDMATQAIAEVRQISHDLRPYQLDQLGLTRALEGMIDGARRSTGFPFERKIDPVDDLFSSEAATHVYRIVQESMNNILKHARAHTAKVLLERDVHHMRLWIEDDGCGFVPEAKSGDRGLGLQNLAERVRILGGKLALDSVPEGGTRVEVLVPLTENT